MKIRFKITHHFFKLFFIFILTLKISIYSKIYFSCCFTFAYFCLHLLFALKVSGEHFVDLLMTKTETLFLVWQLIKECFVYFAVTCRIWIPILCFLSKVPSKSQSQLPSPFLLFFMKEHMAKRFFHSLPIPMQRALTT